MLHTVFIKLVLLNLLIFISVIIYAQEKFLKPDSCILMKAEKGKALLKNCSGSRYQQFVDSFWIPNQQEFDDLQANFYKKSQQQEDIVAYIIQYIGVYMKGQKFIYINAFPKHKLDHIVKIHGDLQSEPVRVCGGGLLYWKALFNNQTKVFDFVQINAPM